jgi:hypothetical protein
MYITLFVSSFSYTISKKKKDEMVTIRNTKTGLVLDSNAKGSAYTHELNGGNFQKWRMRSNRNGTWSLQDVTTNLFLDSDHNGELYTLLANPSPFQKWELIEAKSGGGYHFKNQATGLMLESNHAGDGYTHVKNKLGFQTWTSTLEDGNSGSLSSRFVSLKTILLVAFVASLILAFILF